MYLFLKLLTVCQKRQNLHGNYANIFLDKKQQPRGDTVIERVIYGDVLMIINFSMDFLALYITAKIMHIRLKNRRITLSAILGAVYSLIILTFNKNSLLSGFISFAIAFLLTFTAYGKQKTRDYIKNTIVFYIVNFALGGGITAICNLLNMWQNKRDLMINGTFDVLYGDLPFGLLVILAIVCGIVSLISGKIIKKKAAQKECELEIHLNRIEIKIKALVDSGNLLKEPISGKPVIITAFEAVRKIIPVELIPLFKTKNTDCLENNIFFSRIRLIPTSTVTGQGILFALFPDRVSVDGKEVDVYIAINTGTDNFGGFSAIVPDEIIQ